jgi:hypothetical protein
MIGDTVVELLSEFESDEEEIHVCVCEESTTIEDSASLKDIDVSLLSPLVAKYKKNLDALNKELALSEKKMPVRRTTPSILPRNKRRRTTRRHSRNIVKSTTARNITKRSGRSRPRIV